MASVSEVDMQGITCSYLNIVNSKGIWLNDNPLSYSVPSTMLQLSVLTLLTRFIHFLLKRFGQPLIVSQILGGVILGPSLIGQNATFLEKLFPVKTRLVLDTISIFGFMFVIFLIGVKLDPSMVLRSGRKSLAIGLLAFFVPYTLANFVVFLIKSFTSLDDDVSTVLSSVALLHSLTSFPVIACLLEELKILNSEIGRLASSSSFVCDLCHWSIFSIKVAIDLAKGQSVRVTIGSILSSILLLIVIVFVLRPAALWAIRQTPEGKPVKEIVIFAVVIALLGCGLAGESIGFGALLASLALGLAIPDGPPLGAALVERLDTFVSIILMPLFFATCGLDMDVLSIQTMKNFGVLFAVALTAFVGKMLGTILPLLLCRMPFRDCISLALIMNSKGIVELVILNTLKKKHVLTKECYAILIIWVVLITVVVSPLVKILYDPSKRYVAFRRRTILHSRQNEELRVLACIYSPENVLTIISLLQVTHPKKESRINLVVLHLVALMGRASPLLVAHLPRDKHSQNPSQSERIFNAFRKFEQQNDAVIVQCFKGISPYAAMHNDVCSLALEKRTTLVILPFHKQWAFGEKVETSYALRHLNKNVLEKSPCSVGILLDRGCQKRTRGMVTEPSIYQVAVIFFGGADDREALAYARRMSDHPNITVTLIILKADANEIVAGSARSKMLDAEILSQFKHHSTQNEHITYSEKVVTSGMGVVTVTRSLLNAHDLVLVGRRHGESDIMHQLNTYDEHGELGTVGDVLAASEFDSGASVLVVQQQTKLWGLHDPEESTHLRRIKI